MQSAMKLEGFTACLKCVAFSPNRYKREPYTRELHVALKVHDITVENTHC